MDRGRDLGVRRVVLAERFDADVAGLRVVVALGRSGDALDADRRADRSSELPQRREQVGEGVPLDRLAGRVEDGGAAGELRQWSNLGAIEDADEAEVGTGPLVGIGPRLLPFAQRSLGRGAGRPDRDPVLALLHRVAELQPLAKAGDAAGGRSLMGDQELVVEAVAVEMAANREPALPALAGAQLLDRAGHELALGRSLRGALGLGRSASAGTSLLRHEVLLFCGPPPVGGRPPTQEHGEAVPRSEAVPARRGRVRPRPPLLGIN